MTTSPAAGIVRYGQSSLSDVLPSTLAALGVAGEPNVLALEPAGCIVVLLVDGLGWQLLREHAGLAPFLSSLAARPLTAGFPTTTAVSVTSLGAGVPPGQHGITGYITRADGLSEPANWLTWRGARSGVDLLGDQPPEQVQPVATAFERAEQAGVSATVVSAPAFKGSGLTRAALRGAHYLRAFTAADSMAQVAATAQARGGLIYCYNHELDLIGHVYGCRSEAWRAQLQLIDRAVELLAGRLPAGTRLLVTADHGMVNVPEEAKIDYDSEPSLQEGVELLAGEARVRYLHVEPGLLDAVRSRWLEVVGDRMAVLTRDEAIGHGWFGPEVSASARHRIGDLIAVSVSELAVVRRKAESRNASLIGHHGALTDAELLVPLLST
ncbi:MAG TPA: nucleotide pyrophosphatase/phosphodiesterase family protein [Jatrophihabitans sp.]|jgi:predicted AlkP superfamily pyrophosphatase or phosphodiesterase|uniref:alkaline phosphatase family protein n=1 Tax=Jatrophihabitans sp. TaxID=1932789 RepID=UPI002EFE4F63